MHKKKGSTQSAMMEPAIYRIRVQGHLDTKWSAVLEDMNITEVKNSNDEAETILVGRLDDQAALSGVMNSLYEMHMAVLSTERLEKG
jgi:hypothetical protein